MRMRSRRLLKVGFLVIMFALLAAWPIRGPVASAEEVRAADPDTEFQAEWNALIKAAKREGKLVAITTGRGGLEMAPILKQFSDKFGIKVVISRGSGREQADRVLAEQRADRFAVDTIQTGKSTMNLRYVPNNALQPIEPLLFHPEVIDKSKWYGNRFRYVDGPQRYIFVYAADLSCEGGVRSVWWNTNLVSLEEAASWTSNWDILSEKYAGKLVVRSPMDAGAMGSIAGTFVERGPGYLRRLYANPTLKIFYTNDVNVMTDGIAKGRFHIGLSMGRHGLNKLRDYGAPVQDYDTAAAQHGWKAAKELCDITDHGIDGTITVARNNPHPNTTKLFVNWLLSREGQTVIQATRKVEGVRPDGLHTRQTLRTDGIPRGLVDPATAFSYDKLYTGLDFDPDAEKLRGAVTKWVRAVHREAYFGGPPAPPPPGLPEKFGRFKKYWR